MNKFPLWKYVLVVFVIVVASIYAAPVLFSEDPALQISGTSASVNMDEALLRKINALVREQGIEIKNIEQTSSGTLLRFTSDEARDKAKQQLQDGLGRDYIIALNRAQNTPEWLQSLGARPMNLGLDLRGGVHFLLEVDLSQALEPHLRSYASSIRTQLREEQIKYRQATLENQSIHLRFDDEQERGRASAFLTRNFPEFVLRPQRKDNEFYLVLTLSNQKLNEIKDYAVTQNLVTLRNRVNELGVAEPVVQRQGSGRIVVELPGIQDTAAAKRIIGKTASLEFRLEDWEHTGRSAVEGVVPVGSERFDFKDNRRPPVLTKQRVIVKGDRVINARSGFDENGLPQVSIKLDGQGGKQMHATTSKHVGKNMVVIFIEYKTELKEVMQDGERVQIPVTLEEKYVINVATIRDALGYDFRITGLDNVAEAQELALLLRAGALAAPMYFVEERTVGPSLGAENIKMGINSMIAGFLSTMLFMVFYYKVFGLIANVALVLNLVLLVAIMSLLGATLTMPGMAGFVLLAGMAIDANVLIFSRIREELANGAAPQTAIAAGYDRAFVSIIDSNLTTIAVAVVLFLMGTGAVKGFAVTLVFGILSSLFTSITVTRALVNLIYGGRQLKRLHI